MKDAQFIKVVVIDICKRKAVFSIFDIGNVTGNVKLLDDISYVISDHKIGDIVLLINDQNNGLTETIFLEIMVDQVAMVNGSIRVLLFQFIKMDSGKKPMRNYNAKKDSDDE